MRTAVNEMMFILAGSLWRASWGQNFRLWKERKYRANFEWKTHGSVSFDASFVCDIA
jgi:hypothetical protein